MISLYEIQRYTLDHTHTCTCAHMHICLTHKCLTMQELTMNSVTSVVQLQYGSCHSFKVNKQQVLLCASAFT